MSQIKQLQPKEGVTLLAVKVPEDTVHFDIYDKESLPTALMIYTKHDFFEPGLPSPIPLPEGNWQLLGKATEIQEKIWRSIMPEEASINNEVVKIKFLDIKSNKVFNRAKKAAFSFLEANEVYSVNPLGEKPKMYTGEVPFGFEDNVSSMNQLTEVLIEKWQQAEANTGTYVILKKKI